MRRVAQPLSRVPVLLVPGLMAGDFAMRPLARHLGRLGHPTSSARIGLNVGCTTELVDRLESRLAGMVRERGEPAAIVGHSRGGTLAKLLTMRRPELVAGLICLAAPNVNPLAVSRMVAWQLRFLNRLHAAGMPGLLSADCLSGECALSVRELLQRPFPREVPYHLLYSKTDGVVDWQACCDPAATLIEVSGSHMQLAMSPMVLRQVAVILDTISAVPVAARRAG